MPITGAFAIAFGNQFGHDAVFANAGISQWLLPCLGWCLIIVGFVSLFAELYLEGTAVFYSTRELEKTAKRLERETPGRRALAALDAIAQSWARRNKPRRPDNTS